MKEIKRIKKLLTLVICAYNEEKNLHRLFENLVNQENQNFNIIFVNDGSTDNTLQIAKEYMIKNENCIVISKKNTGLSDSRNMGTKYVKTPYFMYLDADDFLDRDTIGIIEKRLESSEKRLDIFKINVKSVSEEEVIVERNKSVELQEVKGTEAIIELGFIDKLYMLPTVYVFRTEYFRKNNFEFEYGRYHEDYGLIPFTVLLADNVTTTEETLYNYVLSKNSITRTKDNKKAIKKAEDTLYFYKQSILAIEELKKNQNNDGRITKQVYKKFKQLYTNGLIEKLKEMFKIIQTEKNEELRIEIERFFENVKKDNNKKNIALVSNFIIKQNGEIQTKYAKDNKSYMAYIAKLGEENIESYGQFSLEENKGTEIMNDLVTFEKRNILITNILKKLSEYDMKGLEIEVKDIQDTRAFIRFITELKPRLKETGKKLVIKNYEGMSDTIRKIVDYTY